VSVPDEDYSRLSNLSAVSVPDEDYSRLSSLSAVSVPDEKYFSTIRKQQFRPNYSYLLEERAFPLKQDMP
jgi:hypothetical protein